MVQLEPVEVVLRALKHFGEVAAAWVDEVMVSHGIDDWPAHFARELGPPWHPGQVVGHDPQFVAICLEKAWPYFADYYDGDADARAALRAIRGLRNDIAHMNHDYLDEGRAAEELAEIADLVSDFGGETGPIDTLIRQLQPRRYTCSLCYEQGHNRRGCTNVRRCGHCGEPGHRRDGCPSRPRCSNCRRVGHNVRGCPKKVKCGRCGRRGHNVRTCSA